MGCNSTMVNVADDMYLSTDTSMVADFISPAFPNAGNKGVLAVTVNNVAAVTTLDFFLDGSYDGLAWKQILTFAQTVFGQNTGAQAALDYAFLRMRAKLTGTSAKAQFGAKVTMSCQ